MIYKFRKTVFIFSCLLLLSSFAFAYTMEIEYPPVVDDNIPDCLMLSPKISYVGSLAVGIEFCPPLRIFNKIKLMTEANWVYWNWNGANGFGYGEVNLVYDHKMFEAPMVPLNFYIGGGLIYGSVVGDASYGTIVGNFTGGNGYSLFMGFTGKTDPYIWFAQIKYATAPLTLRVTIPRTPFTDPYNIDLPTEALGPGIEFGIRFPL